MAVHKIYLYPVWIRIWHVINALSFLLLVLTGIGLHYAAINAGIMSFDVAVVIHNISATVLTFNYGIFVIGNILSKNGKYYRNLKKDMGPNLWIQLKFYISGILKKESHPFPVNEERKFNPLQKVAYVVVMYVCLPLIIISGIGLLFPEIIIYQVLGISGLAITGFLHQIMGFVLSIFLLVHLYTCTLGTKPGTLYKSMVNGYHEAHE
jgi:thiosulfate reductase cytochrome b subunit